MKKLLVLPGDGIGPAICEAVLPVFKQLALPIEFEIGEIGWSCWQCTGETVPEKTWQQIARSDAVLIGRLNSPNRNQAEASLPVELQGQGMEYISPFAQLQQRLQVFAKVQPVQHLIGKHKPFRCCVISGTCSSNIKETSFDIRHRIAQLFQYAFDYANKQGYRRLTFAGSPTLLHFNEHLVIDILHSIATHFPTIHVDIQNASDLTLALINSPEKFGVIVAENRQGDMLSALSTGMAGGPGVIPSANVGEQICYFTPAHGNEFERAVQEQANPSAMFLSVALTLEHLGFMSEASHIEQAVRSVITKGRHVSYDLGGLAGTRSMAQAILDEIAYPQAARHASILCIGDELLRGQNCNTNAQEFAQRLTQAQYSVNLQMVCGDQTTSIRQALEICLGHADLVVVSGGLGPTSDDVTREALAATAGVSLVLDEASWLTIQRRLHGFGLQVAPSNRRQALFPQGAQIVPNTNGTAPGFTMTICGRTVYVLPGPPKECLPMLESLLAQQKQESTSMPQAVYHMRLFGVIEGDAAQIVDEQLAELRGHADVSYLCHYPHVNIRIAIAARRQAELADKMAELEILFKDHLVSKEEKTALEQLGPYLTQYSLALDDTLTQGTFATRIAAQFVASPSSTNTSNLPTIVKAHTPDSLSPPFQGSAVFQCSIVLGEQSYNYTMRAPKRGPEIVESACEFIAWSILRSCQQMEIEKIKYVENC